MEARTVPSRAGEVLRWRTWMVELKASASETDGQFAFIESNWGPGMGMDPHVHSREDEAIYVVVGSATFPLGRESVKAVPGTLVLAPRGRPHAFTAGADGARLLHVFTPAGIEGFFREWHRDPSLAPRRLVELERRYGLNTPEGPADPG